MAPARQSGPPFEKNERVLCFHHDMLYEAKVIDVKKSDTPGHGWLFKIHYKGWKNTWDDWVPVDRVRKFTDDNIELAERLHSQIRHLATKNKQSARKSGRSTTANGSTPTGGAADNGRAGHEDQHTPISVTHSGRGSRRPVKYHGLEEEDEFRERTLLNLVIADNVKAVLVDDWENITRTNQLVPVPHPHPVDQILDDYLVAEQQRRPEGSPRREALEEIVTGLQDYFNASLGRILLYRFERPQYHDILKLWADPSEEEYTRPSDTYGAEHLSRLLVTIPELVVQTNLDHQSAIRLRAELCHFSEWLARNAGAYFVSEYEAPTTEYIEQTKVV